MLPIIDSVLGIGKDLIERLIPDPSAQIAAKQKLAELHQTGDLAVLTANLQLNIEQIKLNAVESSSNNNFRSGWRPCIGWIGAAGIAYEFIVRPLVNGALIYFTHIDAMPNIDISALMTLITGMLGLGGLRTIEKLQGIK